MRSGDTWTRPKGEGPLLRPQIAGERSEALAGVLAGVCEAVAGTALIVMCGLVPWPGPAVLLVVGGLLLARVTCRVLAWGEADMRAKGRWSR